jgi:hypothetical protein
VCAVQAGVVDMTPIRVHVDEYRPIYDYEQCPEDGAVIGIAASLIAYNVSNNMLSIIMMLILLN